MGVGHKGNKQIMIVCIIQERNIVFQTMIEWVNPTIVSFRIQILYRKYMTLLQSYDYYLQKLKVTLKTHWKLFYINFAEHMY